MKDIKEDINIIRMIPTKKRSELAYTINALNMIYNKPMKYRTIQTKTPSDIARSIATDNQHWVPSVVHNLCTTIATLEYSNSTILTSPRLTPTTLTVLCVFNSGDYMFNN